MWNRRRVTFVLIHRSPADEGPSKSRWHLYGCCADVTNQNRQQLFTPGQQREARVQKARPSLKTPVSSVEEVQRSEGRRGVGAQRKSPKGPKIAADGCPSPSVIHPKCGKWRVMVHRRHGWSRSGHGGDAVKKKPQQQMPLKGGAERHRE